MSWKDLHPAVSFTEVNKKKWKNKTVLLHILTNKKTTQPPQKSTGKQTK